MKGQAKFPPPRVIAVDVDGTLHVNGIPRTDLIDWCRTMKANGFDLMLWSSRGAAYARKAAVLYGIEDLFTVICSKPGHIVDDQGWNWIRYTKVVRSFSFTGPS